MKRCLVLLVAGLVACTVTGCFLDKVFLNTETQDAIKGVEDTKKELAVAKMQLADAKTEEEKQAAQLALERASTRADEALKQLDRALESTAPSTAEAILNFAGENTGGLLGFIIGILGSGVGVYQRQRARKAKGEKLTADAAFREAAEVIEEVGDTEEGQKLKKKAAKKFEKAGVTEYVDGALRAIGALRKSNA